MVCDTEILCVITCTCMHVFFDAECLEALCSPLVANTNTTHISSSSGLHHTASNNQTINGSSARVVSTPLPQLQQPKLGLCDIILAIIVQLW